MSIEKLNGVTGTYQMRNVRELCRAYLSLYFDVAEELPPKYSRECPCCNKKVLSSEELVKDHWRCVEKHILLMDPDSEYGVCDEETPNDGCSRTFCSSRK